MLVELDGLEVGDHGEERPQLYVVRFEDKHDQTTFIHRTSEGAERRILAIAANRYRAWGSDWDTDGSVKKAIDEKDADEVVSLWGELTNDTEFFTYDIELLDD